MAYVVSGTIIHNGVKYYGDPDNGQLTYWDESVATPEENALLVQAGALILEAQAKGASATQTELDALRAQLAALQAAQAQQPAEQPTETPATDAEVLPKSDEQ